MSYGNIVLGTEKAFEGINPEHLKDAIYLDKLSDTELYPLLTQLESKEAYLTISNHAKQFINNRFSANTLFGPFIKSLTTSNR